MQSVIWKKWVFCSYELGFSVLVVALFYYTFSIKRFIRIHLSTLAPYFLLNLSGSILDWFEFGKESQGWMHNPVVVCTRTKNSFIQGKERYRIGANAER